MFPYVPYVVKKLIYENTKYKNIIRKKIVRKKFPNIFPGK